MRYHEIISETPIASFELEGPDGDFAKGTAFSKVDKGILQSQKGRDKIIRAFNRTPFVFNVIFANNNHVKGDNEQDNIGVGEAIMNYEAGIYNKKWRNYTSTPGTITVIMVTNLSPLKNKTPMTAWTLAHKIGHG